MVSGSAVKSFADHGIEDVVANGAVEQDVTCPKCSHLRRKKRAKCLSVNIETGLWNCWHCGRSGSLAHGWVGEPDRERLDQVAILPPKPLRPPKEKTAVEKAWAHLEKTRGMPQSFLAEQGMEVVESYCMFCEERRVAVAAKYTKRGKHVHTKYRDGLKHFWTDSRTERVLYGYDLVVTDDPALRAEPVIVTEGEFDALALRLAGFRRAVSVPDGAPQPQDKNLQLRFAFLDDGDLVAAIRSAPKVILAVDADGPGERLEREFARRFNYACHRVVWPEGIKDANDALIQIGPEGLSEIVRNAEPYPVEGIVAIVDLVPTVEDWFENGMPKGLSTGIPSLDRYVKFLLGQFWLVHAQTGAGKTHFINALLLGMMRENGFPAAYWSPEISPTALHLVSFIETYVGKPFDERMFKGMAMTQAEMREASRWLDEHMVFLRPEDRTVKAVLERAEMAVARRGVRILAFDPWTEFHHPYTRFADKLAYIEETLTALVSAARSLDVLLILSTHQGKPPRQKGGDSGGAGLYGSRDSGDFAGKADVVIELVREAGQGSRVDVKVQKVRSRYLGRTGTIHLVFNRLTGRYDESDEGAAEEGTALAAKIRSDVAL